MVELSNHSFVFYVTIELKVNLVSYNEYLYPNEDFLNDIQRSGVVIERCNSSS